MNRRTLRKNWIARALLFALFAGAFAPAGTALAAKKKQDSAEPNSQIRGKVVGPEGRPAARVEVLAYHLATEETFRATTDPKGRFEFTGLPYGYFDLAARSADGLYVSDQVANVSPGGKNALEFRLLPFSASTQAERRSFPGAEDPTVGIARMVDQRMVGESFWRGAKGISVIAGGGALGLLLIAGGGSEPEASPFLP